MTPSKAKKIQETTILVEGIDAAIISGTARKTFTVGAVTVKAGQAFLLVRSGSDATRYYVVVWQDTQCAYHCSCGCPAHRSHAHTQAVNTYMAARHAPRVTVATKQLPRAADVATKSLVTAQVNDCAMVRGRLSSNHQGFRLMR